MNTPHKNPLLTPFVLPPFDKIQDTDFEPAMIQGIKESEKDIENITSCSETPTFGNTVAALDKSGEMLDRVENVFFNLLSASSNETREVLAQKFAPMLTRHHNNIMLDEKLFQRVKHVWENRPENLTSEQNRLLETTYKA